MEEYYKEIILKRSTKQEKSHKNKMENTKKNG